MNDSALGLADLVNRADVGMIESGRGLGLVDKSLVGVLVAGEIGRQEFQGHVALERGVVSLVDHTHPAFAEFFDDFVMGYGLADHRISLRKVHTAQQVVEARIVTQRIPPWADF